MKAIFTLSCASESKFTNANNHLWAGLMPKQSIRYIERSSADNSYREVFSDNSISLSMSDEDNFITFNLSRAAVSLVTVYDLEGNILSIQQFKAFKNTESLGLKNPLTLYVIRVQVSYSEIQPS